MRDGLIWVCGMLLAIACSGPSTRKLAEASTSGAPEGSAEDAGPPSVAGDCPEVPRAYVFPTGHDEPAAARLAEAGFEVRRLPLDKDPRRLRGVIVFPSQSSTAPDYDAYMDRYDDSLYHFVDRANVILDLAQPAAAELAPRYLPTTHVATRAAGVPAEVHIVSETHPLLAKIGPAGTPLAWPRGTQGDGSFARTGGFEVLLADAQSGGHPLLVDGAYGQGRIVLSALTFDLADDSAPGWLALGKQLFTNLKNQVQAVCARKTQALQLGKSPFEQRLTPGSATLMVLPDTQVYSLLYPGIYSAQTSWIASNARALDTRFVFHLGDIVNNNTDLEWLRASEAMSLLDGVVDYALAPGNHDYGPSGDASSRDTLFNEYFDFEKAGAMPSYGGAYEPDKLDNTYHLFSAGGHDFIALMLEWGPRDEVVAWANGVMDAHPERLGILVTHAYLNNNNRRYDHTDTKHSQDYNPHEYAIPDVNDGEELWQALVRHHRFVMTFNGHVLGDGAGYLASRTDRGTTCHQMLSNYQMRDLGGEGYLRVIELLPDSKTVRVYSYSVLYDELLSETDQELSFELEL